MRTVVVALRERRRRRVARRHGRRRPTTVLFRVKTVCERETRELWIAMYAAASPSLSTDLFLPNATCPAGPHRDRKTALLEDYWFFPFSSQNKNSSEQKKSDWQISGFFLASRRRRGPSVAAGAQRSYCYARTHSADDELRASPSGRNLRRIPVRPTRRGRPGAGPNACQTALNGNRHASGAASLPRPPLGVSGASTTMASPPPRRRPARAAGPAPTRACPAR